jgi:hypothetical protein
LRRLGLPNLQEHVADGLLPLGKSLFVFGRCQPLAGTSAKLNLDRQYGDKQVRLIGGWRGSEHIFDSGPIRGRPSRLKAVTDCIDAIGSRQSFSGLP